MNPTNRRRRSLALVAAALCTPLVAAFSAHAGVLYINSSEVEITSIGPSVMSAKYRMSENSFDQSLSRNSGTAPGDFIQSALGNNSSLSGREWEFSLKHRAGEGFIFSMSDGAFSKTLAWGNFSMPIAGTVTTTLAGVTPGAPFNALYLDAQAERAGAFMTFHSLTFSAAGHDVADGSLFAGAATLGTGPISQTIISSADLSTVDWVLKGRLIGNRDSLPEGDDLVRYMISARQVDFAVIPAPGAIAALIVVGALARRRRR